MIQSLMTAIRIAGMGILAFLALGTPVMADDDDLGAFVREGTCDSPGTVIDDVGDLDRLDASEWRVVGKGEPQPDMAWGEGEDIDQTIDMLTGSNHIVTVHERDDVNAAMIACGQIAGEVGDDGTLMIDLDQVDGSGFTGRVHFAPEHDDDDDETEVTTVVWQGASATAEATPGV